MTFLEAVELNLDFDDELCGDLVIGNYCFSSVYPEDNVTDLDDYEVGDTVNVPGTDYNLKITNIHDEGYVDLVGCE